MNIAFYKATRPGIQGIFNRLVRWWTNGPYSHCEIVLATVLITNQSFCASSSFIDGGVRGKWIVLDAGHWDFVEIEADPIKVCDWFKDHDGQKYDTLGLFGFIGRRQDGNKKKWLCSESVAAAIGMDEPWRFDPNTFAAVLKSQKLRG